MSESDIKYDLTTGLACNPDIGIRVHVSDIIIQILSEDQSASGT